MRRLLWFPLFAIFSLAACGGGGSGSHGGGIAPGLPPGAPGAPGSTNSGSPQIKFTMKIPAPSGASTGRMPKFISSATNGVLATVYAHTDATHSNPLASVAVSVASGSPNCTGSAPRSCTLSIPAPVGDDDFVFATYDTAPANGAIPNTAKLLGYAGVTQTITANQANTVSVGIGGVIAALSGVPATLLSLSDGATHSIALLVTPTDFGNQPITAGTNDPLANPITVSATESGGSGHLLFSLNGGTPAATATITHTTDTVAAVYDGKGAAGYSATITASAPAVAGQGGASETAALSVFALGSTSADYTPGTLALRGNGDLPALTISDPAAATGPFTITRGSGCYGQALPEKTGTATFNVLALGSAVANGCTVGISDGTNALNVNVSNTYSTVFNGAPTFTSFPTITVGAEADGAMWYGEWGHSAIGRIPVTAAAGSSAQETETPVLSTTNSSVYPTDVAPGPDGNIWWSDCGGTDVGYVTPSFAATPLAPSISGADPSALVAGPDGAMWFADASPPYDVGRVDPVTHGITEFPTGATSSIYSIAEAPDGNLWFASCDHHIYKISPSTDTVTAVTATVGMPSAITVGPDGNLWWFECGSPSEIGTIHPDGTGLHEYPLPAAFSSDYNSIAVGSDGAIWFVDESSSELGRITTSGTITDYSASTTPSTGTYGLAAGPDGNLWFTECGNPGEIVKTAI